MTASDAARLRARSDAHFAIGLCRGCTLPAVPGRKWCEDHLAGFRLRQRRLRAERRRLGRCSEGPCTRLSFRGSSLCVLHGLKQRERVRRYDARRVADRRARGLCVSCGDVETGGYWLCPECAALLRIPAAERTESKLAARVRSITRWRAARAA